MVWKWQVFCNLYLVAGSTKMPCSMCLSCISLDVYRPQIKLLSCKHLMVLPCFGA